MQDLQAGWTLFLPHFIVMTVVFMKMNTIITLSLSEV